MRRPTGGESPGRRAGAPLVAELPILPGRARGHVRRAFATAMGLQAGIEPRLRTVLVTVLANPGGMARAQLGYAMSVAHHLGTGPALALATGVEYFHTASLLLDDLPCMDDASIRRGRPCPHRVHGEAVTILAALSLVTAGYRLLGQAAASRPAALRTRGARLVAACLGPNGILSGQARDLSFRPHPGQAREAIAIAAAKTVPLVRLALVLPAVLGDASRPAIRRLERLALAWGHAYQTLDDLKDGLLTEREAGKSTGRDRLLDRPSLPVLAGPAAALAWLERRLGDARRTVGTLASHGGPPWQALVRLQELLDTAAIRVRAGSAGTVLA